MESSKIIEALWDRMQARDWEGLGELLADQLAVVHHKDASIHGALIQG